MIVSFYLNIIKSVDAQSDGLNKVIMIYIIVMVPRWYLYNPNQLIREVLLLSLVYWIAVVVNSITSRKSDKHTNINNKYRMED